MEARVVVAERRILRGERDAELGRLDEAMRSADQQLDELRGFVGAGSGDGVALIEAHKLMLRSPELAGETRRMIHDECLGAEWALTRALDVIRATFAKLDDPFFRARSGDFEATGERLLRVLLGLPELRPGKGARPGAIAVCVDLSPLDPFQLKKAGVAGIVSESGGKTSHAAIIARELGLPYVVGIERLAGKARPGAMLILDGTHGEVIVDPDAETLDDYRARADLDTRHLEELGAIRTLPSVTADGVRIHLAANVESIAGVSAARAAGAESIGLFRTEFLYLDRPDVPSEEEQYQDALSALRAADGLPITFRTLDLGGDKLPIALKIPTGANPALGMRAIRFSLRRADIFRTQLRALYRAAALGPVRMMFPLIAGVTELDQARAICQEVRADLDATEAGTAPGTVPLGVMVETPSAAITVDHLARRCDFLSIGTNDLIQYAFAADRDNDDVSYLYQPFHPAVLRFLKLAVDAANAARVPVSLCGDLASEPTLTWLLIGLGLRDLSIDPAAIPIVKALVRACRVTDAEALVKEALALDNEIAIGALVTRTISERLPPELRDFLAAWS
jgi:phosphotransferase system enzyme I (PtsI)